VREIAPGEPLAQSRVLSSDRWFLFCALQAESGETSRVTGAEKDANLAFGTQVIPHPAQIRAVGAENQISVPAERGDPVVVRLDGAGGTVGKYGSYFWR
jgi:hypothetical protein